MKNMMTKDSAISVLLLVILYFCYAPLSMPIAVSMFVHGIFVILYIAFALFIWRESARDEREAKHQAAAGRFAFIVGAGVLVIGIVQQGLLMHEVDQWLVFALAAMVLAKMSARVYCEHKN